MCMIGHERPGIAAGAGFRQEKRKPSDKVFSIYVIGILVQIPFLSTAFYTGPLVEPLGGVDISWIVGLVVPGVMYFASGRGSQRRAPAQLILPS